MNNWIFAPVYIFVADDEDAEPVDMWINLATAQSVTFRPGAVNIGTGISVCHIRDSEAIEKIQNYVSGHELK